MPHHARLTDQRWDLVLGGRPPEFDAATCKNRNVVERSFALLKRWRGLATRFDRLTVVCRSAAALAGVPVRARI